MQAHLLAFQLIAKGDDHAIALVGSDIERLDHVGLETGGDGAGIVSFFLSCLPVDLLYVADLLDILAQNIHIPREKVQPLIDGDFRIDRRDVKLSSGGVRRTTAALRNALADTGRAEEI